MQKLRCVVAFVSLVIISGCATQIPKEVLQLSEESSSLRQLQTRRFDTKDEKALLAAGAAVLQDLGFTIDASETALGLIVASKDRSAVEAGQVAASIFVALITVPTGAPLLIPWDKNQKMRASFITRAHGSNKEHTLARITFQRIVWNTKNEVSKTEPLTDAKFYQEFFEKLSKAVFLEAHEF